MRVRALAALAVLAALAGGCGRDPSTKLSVDISNGSDERSYILECDPPGGTHPRAIAACDALEEHSAVMLRDSVSTCIGGIGTIHILVAGEFRGKPVQAEPDLCSGNGEGEQLWLKDVPKLDDAL